MSNADHRALRAHSKARHAPKRVFPWLRPLIIDEYQDDVIVKEMTGAARRPRWQMAFTRWLYRMTLLRWAWPAWVWRLGAGNGTGSTDQSTRS